MMPSPYTSTESLDDAAAVAKALACRFDSIHITAAMEALGETLGGSLLAGRVAGYGGRKYPVALPRAYSYGAIEQIRVDGAVDRQ